MQIYVNVSAKGMIPNTIPIPALLVTDTYIHKRVTMAKIAIVNPFCFTILITFIMYAGYVL